MKSILLFICIAAPFFFSSCGSVAKSMLHTSKQIKLADAENKPLPTVSIKVGQKAHGFKSRVGYPFSYWGYIPTLVPENENILRCEKVTVRGGYDTYIKGIKPGITKVYLLNGLVHPANTFDRDDPYFDLPSSYYFKVLVEERSGGE